MRPFPGWEQAKKPGMLGGSVIEVFTDTLKYTWYLKKQSSNVPRRYWKHGRQKAQPCGCELGHSKRSSSLNWEGLARSRDRPTSRAGSFFLSTFIIAFKWSLVGVQDGAFQFLLAAFDLYYSLLRQSEACDQNLWEVLVSLKIINIDCWCFIPVLRPQNRSETSSDLVSCVLISSFLHLELDLNRQMSASLLCNF